MRERASADVWLGVEDTAGIRETVCEGMLVDVRTCVVREGMNEGGVGRRVGSGRVRRSEGAQGESSKSRSKAWLSGESVVLWRVCM